MKQLRFLSLLILVATVGFAGCSDELNSPATTDPVGTDDFAAIDLNLPNGGLTPTNEEVAFGDPFLMQEEARDDEELYDDALLAETDVARIVADCDSIRDGRPKRKSYFLRLVWGNLDGPVDEVTGEVVDAARVDWSGALQIDRGVVIVRRVIRFERGVDSITRPRPDRQTVEWTSFTGGHFDGILVQIIEPASRPDDSLAPDYEPNRIRVKAGAFSAEFLTSDIPGLDRTADVGDDGSIHFTGYEYNGRLGCPRGFLAGIWRMAPEDSDFEGGFFRGRWVNIIGTTRGYMQGRYGLNDEGRRVFAGKYISRKGRFLGFLRGTWEPGDEPGRGQFRGEWINEAETREGVLGGRYKQAGDRPGGFYQGRWTADCDRSAVDAIE